MSHEKQPKFRDPLWNISIIYPNIIMYIYMKITIEVDV